MLINCIKNNKLPDPFSPTTGPLSPATGPLSPRTDNLGKFKGIQSSNCMDNLKCRRRHFKLEQIYMNNLPNEFIKIDIDKLIFPLIINDDYDKFLELCKGFYKKL